jgi:hypothetical protein
MGDGIRKQHPHALKCHDQMPVRPEICLLFIPVQPGKGRAGAMEDVTVSLFYGSSEITTMKPTRNTVLHHLILNYICSSRCKSSILFFDFLNCNDGGSTLLRNSGNCLPILNLHQHRCDNLKSRTSAVAIMYPTNPHQPVDTFYLRGSPKQSL